MKSTRILLLCVVFAVIAGCGGGGGGSSSSAPAAPPVPTISLPNGLTLPPVTGNNVLTITVDGSECSAASVAAWPNKPCVSVTICDPSNAYCQSVNDILLDTGDYGVRIFQQALPSNLLAALTQVESGSLPVYECVEYGDGSKVWGPVQVANVWLTGLTGGEKAQVPIQVIGSTTPDLISGSRHACSGAWSSPTTAYYNGSLGLGLFVQDCGETCAPPTLRTEITSRAAGARAPELRSLWPVRFRTRSQAFLSTITASACCSPASLPVDHLRRRATSCSASAPSRITALPELSPTARTRAGTSPRPSTAPLTQASSTLAPTASSSPTARSRHAATGTAPRPRSPYRPRLRAQAVPRAAQSTSRSRTTTPSPPLRTTYSPTSAGRRRRSCQVSLTGGSPSSLEETCM